MFKRMSQILVMAMLMVLFYASASMACPTPISVPEPASLLLLGAGITGIVALKRKKG